MNKGPDHLSRLEHGEEPINLEDTLPDAQLLTIRTRGLYPACIK
jgi:hypothetical protein